MGDAGLLGLELQPDAFDTLGELIEQLPACVAGPLHADDEVVGVPDEPVGRVALATQRLAGAGVIAHPLPVRLVVAVQRGQRDVGEQRRDDPALRRARHRPLKTTRFPHHSGLQQRPHERQHATVFDPPSDLTQKLGVVDAVKARLDVRLNNPLVVGGVAREAVNLGDRVLRPAAGPVAVAGRVEVRLEDRLHDELEGHLHDPVLERRDPETTHPAIALGNQSLADRQRPELAGLQLAAQPPKELLHADVLFDVTASLAVDPGRP